MNTFNRPPLAAPDDFERFPPKSSPSRVEATIGQFLAFGFFGQIVYSFIQWNIASGATRQTSDRCVLQQMAWLLLPLVCAVLGAVSARKSASPVVLHPLTTVSLAIGIVLLGLWNLLVMFVVTTWSGYC